MSPYLVLATFHIDPLFSAKGPVIYGCMIIIWSSSPVELILPITTELFYVTAKEYYNKHDWIVKLLFLQN